MHCIKYFILRGEFYRKIDNIVPTFKHLIPSLQAIGDLHKSLYVNIQLAKFMSSCFDLRNILLSNQTNENAHMNIILTVEKDRKT